jgi:hypothetical protein
MDVRCCTCGEPWDQYFLRHDLEDQEEAEPGSLAAEGWEFGSSRLVVIRCPSCPKDGTGLPDAAGRSQATQVVADLLGDDEDGLASTLEDFDLFFSIQNKAVPPRDTDCFFNEADMVFSYTRTQAIADGVLVDVSETAKEAGFRIPVVVTRALWDQYIVPVPLMVEDGQSITGRLWDVLNVLLVAIRASPSETAALTFSVLFRMPKDTETVRLKAVCGPDDNAEPVITIMFPDED